MRRAWNFVFALFVFGGLSARVAPDASAAEIFEKVGIGIMDLDPSLGSVAMSGASGAVNWTADPDAWANPALLGSVHGLRLTGGRGLIADDISTYHIAHGELGGGGVGLATAGQPFDGLGRLELDSKPMFYSTAYGPSGTSQSIMRERSWGVGASVAGIANTLAGRAHRDAPGFARHADLAFGWSQKVVETWFTDDPASRSRAAVDDAGLLASVHTTLARGGGDAAPLRLDAAYGFTAHNLGPGWLTGNEKTTMMQRQFRNALSVRGALGLPGAWRRAAPAWMAPALEPMVSLGLALDFLHPTAASGRSGTRHYGAELALTRVLALRLGYTHWPGYTSPTTWGYTITLPFRDVAGVSYSYASVPTNPELMSKPNRYDSGSVWLDPVALWRARF